MSTVLCLLCAFLSLKNDLNVSSKRNTLKNFIEKRFYCFGFFRLYKATNCENHTLTEITDFI
jgi:hypothetical protein